MTAAANQLASAGNLELFSLTILQGAFSHNALARQVKPGLAGAFPLVVGKPAGPIAITHTHNDLACTIAYALASRLSRDIAQAIGDASDEFGAMGANGPQKLDPGAAELDDTAQVFAPKRGKVNTFLADQFIFKTNETDAPATSPIRLSAICSLRRFLREQSSMPRQLPRRRIAVVNPSTAASKQTTISNQGARKSARRPPHH